MLRILSRVALAALATIAFHAQAVPSFARQTQQECSTCHIGAFGPQLTPYGIKFKLGGYTETNGDQANVPLSGMVLAGMTHTRKDNPNPPKHYGANDNATLEEASIFLAGKLFSGVGAFAQMTWEGLGRRWEMDSLDVRYARELSLGGKDITTGLSFNNRPTVQDPLNTMSVWRFPFNGAPDDLAATPSAAPVLDGALDGRVFGLTAYAHVDNGLYAELGGYRAATKGYMINTGQIPDRSDPGEKLVGLSPYWRVGYLKMGSKDMMSVGMVGMSGKQRPFGSQGPGDKFNDIGLDASYQYLGNRQHIFAVAASYIRERQTLDETFAAAESQNRKLTLNQARVSGSYHYQNTYGATLSRFETTGSSDNLLYANEKPDSRGWVVQLDWTPFGKQDSWGAPWANVRIGLQHTRYEKFDGTAQSAGDHDTTNLFVWTAF